MPIYLTNASTLQSCEDDSYRYITMDDINVMVLNLSAKGHFIYSNSIKYVKITFKFSNKITANAITYVIICNSALVKGRGLGGTKSRRNRWYPYQRRSLTMPVRNNIAIRSYFHCACAGVRCFWRNLSLAAFAATNSWLTLLFFICLKDLDELVSK